MKRFFLIAALAISTLVTAEEPNKTLAAQSLISSQLEMKDNDQLQVQFNNPLQKKIVVKVYSDSGVLIMKRTIDGNAQYNGLYDLEDLSTGDYQFGLYLNNELIERKTIAVK